MPSADSARADILPCGACLVSEEMIACSVTVRPLWRMRLSPIPTNYRLTLRQPSDLRGDLGLDERPLAVGDFAERFGLWQVGVRMGVSAEAADRGRSAQQIALDLVAAFFLEEAQLLVGLDAFGDHRQAEALAEAEHGAHDRGRLLVRMDLLDERAVDLDPVERKGAQVRKRRVAGAEIVHRDLDAERLDLTQRRQRAVEVAHQRRFGDLDLEPLAGQAGLDQRLMKLLG